MKYAILADIHANLEALEAVLKDKYFINPGSVGQPRDGDPRAAYATYEPDTGRVELRRVDYDIPGAQGKVDAAGLPRRPRS